MSDLSQNSSESSPFAYVKITDDVYLFIKGLLRVFFQPLNSPPESERWLLLSLYTWDPKMCNIFMNMIPIQVLFRKTNLRKISQFFATPLFVKKIDERSFVYAFKYLQGYHIISEIHLI